MHFIKRMSTVLCAALFILAVHISPISAAVLTPLLDIQTLTGDTGVVSSDGNLVMDATAFSITTSSGPLDIGDQDFLLTATYFGSTCVGRMMRDCTYSFTNATLNIGSLLTAEVNNLTLVSICGGTGGFYADLVYTGGSLQGSLTNGLIGGTFSNATTTNFSLDFSADSMIGKVGPVVVPLPAAFWLFGVGLVGLVGVARRRK